MPRASEEELACAVTCPPKVLAVVSAFAEAFTRSTPVFSTIAFPSPRSMPVARAEATEAEVPFLAAEKVYSSAGVMTLPLSSRTAAFRFPGSPTRMVIVPVEESKPSMREKKSSFSPVRKRTHFPTRSDGSWPMREASTKVNEPTLLSSVTVDVSSSLPTLAPWAKEVASAEASTRMRLRLKT